MTLRFSLIFATALLGACASLPPSQLARQDAQHTFLLEGRFALRVTLPGQGAQNSGGRLTWTHEKFGDRVLLASPLGYGLAEIETRPDFSRLRTADGKMRESNDPDALIEEVTGQRLPVRRLPAWLLGQAHDKGPGKAQITTDALGRPDRLVEDGWQVDYSYEDASPNALPARITLSRANEIELRLRIENWREAP